jgi:MFS family permease
MATTAGRPTAETEPVIDPERSRRALVAGSVGNFIEWYEFGVYGYFATILAANFFATAGSSPVEDLVKAYASFALAFFFRPVGAALFGRIGDRIGRRPTLILVLVLMAGATTLIGILPTRESIGALAPWLLTLVRILQGLSAGGEFGGAVSIMTEFAPPGRRGLFGSLQSFTVALGLLAGAGLAALLSVVLSPEQLNSFGWRIPFLLALPLGAVALWLRLRLEETPAFVATQRDREATATGSPNPHAAPPVVRPTAGQTLRVIMLGISRIMGWSAAGYTFLVVLPSYLQTSLNATFRAALAATVVANVGFALAIIPAGLLSDRVGRRPVMVAGALLTTILALPLINVLQNEDASGLAKSAAVFVAGLVVGMMAGPGPAMLSEMFPTTVRYTGLGLSYSLSNAIFSGSAGLIITELIKRTDNIDIPAFYVMATCTVSVFALLSLRGDDHRRALTA